MRRPLAARRGTLRLLFVAVTLLAASPLAAAAAPALHLAWNDCAGAGVSTQSFACNTNIGVEILIPSFVPPPGITQFVSAEARIRIFNDGTLPSWWSMGTGQCRAGSLLFSADLAGTVNGCEDPYAGNGAGGAAMSTLTVGQIQMAVGRPTAVALDPATEYFVGAIRINHAKTAGAGACAGCTEPRGIYFESLRLNQQDGSFYDFPLFRNTGTLAYVNWQCPGQPQIFYDSIHQFWELDGWSFAGCTTGGKNRTWGSIKGLYR